MSPYAKNLKNALNAISAEHGAIRSKESNGAMFAVAFVDGLSKEQAFNLSSDSSITIEFDPWGERAEVRYYG